MKIAVCDDQEIFIKAIKKIIWSLSSLDITTFDSSVKLVESIKKGERYHIFILDIEMPDLDGMVLAKFIRKNFENAIIIFITSHTDYVYDAFEVEAFRFIPKNKINEKLLPAIESAIEKLRKPDESCYIVKGTQCEKVLIKNIIYVDYMSKYISIHTSDNEVKKERIYLHNFMESINSDKFIYISKSVVVNLDWVRNIDDRGVMLKNGDYLLVSRRWLKEVRSILLEYWHREYV